MTIIQAIQAAESGKHITNSFLSVSDSFLKYVTNGTFYCYTADADGFTEYKYEVREFNMAEILSTSWKVVDNKINPHKNGK